MNKKFKKNLDKALNKTAVIMNLILIAVSLSIMLFSAIFGVLSLFPGWIGIGASLFFIYFCFFLFLEIGVPYIHKLNNLEAKK